MNSKKIIITLTLLGFFAWSSHHLYRFTVADLHARAGKTSLNKGDYKAAQTDLASSIRYAGSTDAYHQAYAESLYAQAKKAGSAEAALDLLQQAKKAYQRATELNPLEGYHWLGLAKTCWWLARFKGHEREGDEVESFFLQAVATDPNNGEFLYNVVNYYLTSGSDEKSLDYVRRLAMVYPNGYRDLTKHPRWSEVSENQFRSGLQAATTNVLVGEQALQLLASIAAQEKDWAQAAAYTKRVIQNSKSKISPGLYVNLGRYYFELENYGQAKQAFLQALRISAKRDQMLQSLSGYFRKAAALDFYVQLCQETAAFDATVRSTLPLMLGKAYFYDNNFDLAIQQLKRSLQERETAEAHRYLAEIAIKKRDWDTAELESQRATVLDPGNRHFHSLFVSSLLAQKKYQSALEAVTQAIQEVKPPVPGFYNTQAQLQWKLEDYHAAIQAWETAKSIAPQNAYYPGQIARAYKMLEDFNSAESYYLAALKLKPNDKKLHQELADVRKLNGQ